MYQPAMEMLSGDAPWYVYVRFVCATGFFISTVGFLWLQRDAQFWNTSIMGDAMRWRFVAFVVLPMAATTASAEQAFLETPPGARIYASVVAMVVSLWSLAYTWIETEPPSWWPRLRSWWKNRRANR